jgi:hypothetical protein
VAIVGFIYALKVLIKHQMPSKPRYRLLHRSLNICKRGIVFIVYFFAGNAPVSRD